MIICCYVVTWLLFWIPSMGIAERFVSGTTLCEIPIDLISMFIGAFSGYAAFWAYLMSPMLGLFFSIVFWGTGLYFYTKKMVSTKMRRIQPVSLPVRIGLLFGIFYICCLILYGGTENIEALSAFL